MWFADVRRALAARFTQRRARWIARRHRPQAEQTLHSRRLYILPTAACSGFVLLLLILALLAINFENNLIYALTFLLAALLVVSMHHTHGNLRGLQVAAGRVTPGFADRPLGMAVKLSAGDRAHRNLSLAYPGGDVRHVSLDAGEQVELELSVMPTARGWFYPGYLRIQTAYPLGLFRTWTWLDLATPALVYPAPLAGGELPALSGLGEGGYERPQGQDEFAGLHAYQPGMPLRQVAWKHYARGQGLHAKQFNDQVADGSYLSWQQWPELGTEQRLSRLCYWALILEQRGLPFALELPGLSIEPGQGEAHLQQVLKALALFSQEPAHA